MPHTTVFYVDDDPDDLIFFKDAIDEIGKKVSLFQISENLLYAMRNPPPRPAVVFLDLNMPGKSGLDILREIKSSEVFNDIPVVILSTSNDRTVIEKCRNLGAQFYITKSTSIKGLKKSIEYAINIDWPVFSPTHDEFVYKG